MAWMRTLAARTGRPVIFAMTQNDHDPTSWQRMLDLCAEAADDGANVHPQVAGRPVNLLLGLETFHPFSYCPSWGPLGFLGVPERLEHMADPAFRATMLEEVAHLDPAFMEFLDPERVFAMGAVPNYEPPRSESIAEQARRAGITPMERYYDVLMEDGGRQLIMRPLLNYTDFSLDAVRDMLTHPTTVWGLGDGGAHCGTTCDASTPTFMLSHWTRDRPEGRLSIEYIVAKMTSETATLFGLTDRGVVAPGMVGDLNIIDYDALSLPRPEMVHDLPGDARRFVQGSTGYVATIKCGEVTFRNGVDQGARPGKLLRGVR